MRIKGMSVVLFIVVLALIAGCSGGQSGNQSKNQPNGKQSKQAASQQTARPAQQKKNPQPKTALGTISKVQLDKDRIYLLPTKGERMRFRVTKKSRVIVNGKKAGLSDLQKGQQAKIEYRPGKNSGRIQNIQVFGGAGGGKTVGGGSGKGSGEKTNGT